MKIRVRLLVVTRFFGWAAAAWLLLLTTASVLFAQAPIPGLMYQWRILSMTGQTPANANAPLTSMSAPSINDNGAVAFPAVFNGGGQGVVAASPTLPQTLISFANPVSGRNFGPSVQINDANQVLAQDLASGSPPFYFDRLWLANVSGSFTTLIQSGAGQPFSSVLANGGVNKNGDAVMPALNQQSKLELVSVKGGAVAGQLLLPTGTFAFPQIADTGSILVTFGPQTGATPSPIEIYNQTLSAVQVTVADSTCFSALGNQPGISSDGMVVAFYGMPSGSASCPTASAAELGGTTPGIFAYVNTPAGWSYVRVTGNSGELGFDDNSNSLAFNPSGYSTGSRVAVVNLGLMACPPTGVCATGVKPVQGNSFVISFIGTPSGASKTNPWVDKFPLLFSAAQGLWTIRVDLQYELSAPTTLVIHPTTAIKVVQIGDMIDGNVISSISVFDPLANAAEDDSGNIRTMRRGDHRVAFLAITSTGGYLIVRGDHLDSDQDGLLDHWETTGIDMDQDGKVDLNLPAMGANPNVRDLFLEFDWLDDLTASSQFQPAPGVISPIAGQTYTVNGLPVSFLVSMFNSAPELSGDIYGVRSDGAAPDPISKGITLHIDGGPGNDVAGNPFSVNMGSDPKLLDGGLTATAADGGLAEVVYFGPPVGQPNSVTAPWTDTIAFESVKSSLVGALDKDGRELAFHFALFGDYYGFYTDGGRCPPTCTGENSWSVATATPTTLTSASALPTSMNATGGDVVKIVGGTGAGQYGPLGPPNFATKTLTLASGLMWNTKPDSTSSFAILNGSTGLAENNEQLSPDYNILPGNDFIVTMGGAGRFGYITPTSGTTSGYILGTNCQQWRTAAHELGHTLGLRHGGTDDNTHKGTAYLSLMSYDWQLYCAGPNPNFPTTPVPQSYSSATDLTFDDWASLQGDFPDVQIHLGNTLGLGFGGVPEDQQQAPEQTGLDYMNQNGPPVTTPPTVKIQTPAANGNVGLTLPLQVVVNASDAHPIASVTVAFDVNGDGTIGSGETIAAKLSSTNTYKASFPAISGPTGTRTITAAAIDGTGYSATSKISVNVIEPNPVPSLTSLSPPSATHGGKAFTLTVKGSNLVSGCTVQWNGKGVSTTFVNSGQVTAKITAADIATAGTATVTVKNPAPGGGTSNALPFTIN